MSDDLINSERVLFAAGCFWGVEHYFRSVDGVVGTTVGYTGGHAQNPSYRDVCSGETGHVEAVEIRYNAAEISFETLVRIFFEIHNPSLVSHTSGKRSQYRSALFYTTDEQRAIAEKLMNLLREKDIVVQTEIRSAGLFYKAEENHQDFYSRQGKTDAVRCRTPRF